MAYFNHSELEVSVGTLANMFGRRMASKEQLQIKQLTGAHCFAVRRYALDTIVFIDNGLSVAIKQLTPIANDNEKGLLEYLSNVPGATDKFKAASPTLISLQT